MPYDFYKNGRPIKCRVCRSPGAFVKSDGSFVCKWCGQGMPEDFEVLESLDVLPKLYSEQDLIDFANYFWNEHAGKHRCEAQNYVFIWPGKK